MKRNLVRRLAAVLALVSAAALWAAPAALGENVHLVVATWGNTGRLVESLVETYRETNPHVTIEVIENGAFEVHNDVVLARTIGGLQLDIIYASSSSGLHFVPSGLIEPLNDYLERDGIDLSDYPRLVIESVDIYGDGTIWGLPFVAFNVMFNYNKDLFDGAGVEYPTPDWRWEHEFVDAARKLTRDVSGDGEPDVYGARFDIVQSHMAYGPYLAWGARVLEPGYREAAFDSPESVRFLEFWHELVNGRRIVAQGLGSIAAGDVAMAILNMDSRTVTQYHRDVQVMPKGPTGETYSYGDTNNWLLMAGSSNKEEAWEFLKFLWREAPRYWSDEGIRLPITPYMDPAEWQYAPSSPAFQAGMGPANHMVYFDLIQTARIWPRVAETELRRQVWEVLVPRVFRDELSPAATAGEMQRIGQALLDEWWGSIGP